MTKQELKNLIDEVIVDNDSGLISAIQLNDILKKIVDSFSLSEANPVGNSSVSLKKLRIDGSIYNVKGVKGDSGHNPNLGIYSINDYNTKAPRSNIQNGDFILVYEGQPHVCYIYTWDRVQWVSTGVVAQIEFSHEWLTQEQYDEMTHHTEGMTYFVFEEET